MSLKTYYSGLALALALALAGCLDENPSFDEPAATALTSAGAPASSSSSSATSSGPATTSTTALSETTASADTETTSVTETGSTSGDTTASLSSSDETMEASTGATTGASEQSLEVLADQAGCYVRTAGGVIEAWASNCEQVSSQGNSNNDEGELVVDGLNDDFNGHASRGLLRFPWPEQLDGAQLLTLELQLVVTDNEPGAASDETGELWSSGPFNLTAQEPMDEPALQSMLAPSLGAAELNDVFVWTLPTDAWTPGEALHLQLVPVSDNGVHYWNLNAPTNPALPRLLVTFSE